MKLSLLVIKLIGFFSVRLNKLSLRSNMIKVITLAAWVTIMVADWWVIIYLTHVHKFTTLLPKRKRVETILTLLVATNFLVALLLWLVFKN